MKLFLHLLPFCLLTFTPVFAQDEEAETSPTPEKAAEATTEATPEPTPEPTPDEATMKAAEKLGEITGLKEQFASGFQSMMPMIVQQAERMQLDNEQRAQLLQIYRDWFNEDLDQQWMFDQSVLLYARSFSQGELEAIIEFYQTPAGKKALLVLPQLVQQGAELGMREAQSKQDELLERLKPFLESVKAEREVAEEEKPADSEETSESEETSTSN